MFKTLALISIILAGVLLLVGFIAWAACDSILLCSARVYVMLSQLFALATIAFLLFQMVKSQETS